MTGSSFEAFMFQISFDSCVSFLCFSWLKDFLWFENLYDIRNVGKLNKWICRKHLVIL